MTKTPLFTRKTANDEAAALNKTPGLTAVVGQHKTNGELRFVVHVTHENKDLLPYTVAR